jgi:hypothetical protein
VNETVPTGSISHVFVYRNKDRLQSEEQTAACEAQIGLDGTFPPNSGKSRWGMHLPSAEREKEAGGAKGVESS